MLVALTWRRAVAIAATPMASTLLSWRFSTPDDRKAKAVS